MSESNGRPTYRTSKLIEALVALNEIGAATKPQIEQEPDGTRRQRPALLRLPAESLGLRLALNKNSLRIIGESWDEKLNELKTELGLDKRASDLPQEERQVFLAGQMKNVEVFNRRVEKMGKEEVEWSSPAVIRSKQIGERELSDDWLAKLLAVGIIVMDIETPGPPKDAKPKKTITQTVEVN